MLCIVELMSSQNIRCSTQRFGIHRRETIEWINVSHSDICSRRLFSHNGPYRSGRFISKSGIDNSTKRDTCKLAMTVIEEISRFVLKDKIIFFYSFFLRTNRKTLKRGYHWMSHVTSLILQIF